MAESKLIAKELALDKPILFYKEFVTLHHANYNKETRKLQIGRVNLKDKKVIGKSSFEIDMKGLRRLGVLRFIQAIAHSITKQELENAKLKKRIRELEVSLNPRPLCVDPLSIMVSEKFPEGVTKSNSKVTKFVKLLMGVIKYVVENIDKRLGIIMEALAIATKVGVMTGRVFSLE